MNEIQRRLGSGWLFGGSTFFFLSFSFPLNGGKVMIAKRCTHDLIMGRTNGAANVVPFPGWRLSFGESG
jgi:hypothetical protein